MLMSNAYLSNWHVPDCDAAPDCDGMMSGKHRSNPQRILLSFWDLT